MGRWLPEEDMLRGGDERSLYIQLAGECLVSVVSLTQAAGVVGRMDMSIGFFVVRGWMV